MKKALENALLMCSLFSLTFLENQLVNFGVGSSEVTI